VSFSTNFSLGTQRPEAKALSFEPWASGEKLAENTFGERPVLAHRVRTSRQFL